MNSLHRAMVEDAIMNGRRTTRMLAVLVAGGLGLSCAGCSFAFSRGPKVDPKETGPEAALDCTDHPWWALMDVSIVSSMVLALIIPAATETGVWAREYKPYAISPEAGALVGGAGIVISGISAIHGFNVLGQCARAHHRKKELGEGMGSAPLVHEEPRRDARTPPPPPGAAGFVFGELMDEAAATCWGAGLQWSEAAGAARCSGKPSGELPDASAQLEFTDGRLSAIELVIDPAEGAAGLAGALRDTEVALVRLFGKPGQRSFVIPDECKAEEAFLGCVIDGRVSGRASWSLPDGRTMTLSIAGAPPPATIRVRITPKRPEP
ncbi:hypothetical protein BE21_44260 [Sorangium cellulosum]|uniref:Uncharacterized protein n=1 Tax=Sorangium cellulosum TaxID=56 RepID=A0A150TJM4_SORCE|nr:hypothetical protein BE21_44260 [Sorangium cellulosum]